MAECMDSTINNSNTPKQSIAIVNNDINEESKTDKVMEILLLEELVADNLPKSFEKLVNYVKPGGILENKYDYLVLLCHTLLLETGFLTEGCTEFYHCQKFGFDYKRILETITKLPENWKRSDAAYVLSYVFPPFVDLVCNITFVASRDDMVVNVYFPQKENVTFTMLLECDRYIISAATKLENKFRDIRHLSLIFKDVICNPVRNWLLKYNKQPALCLEDMPYDIFLHLKYFITMASWGNLQQTNRYFASFIRPNLRNQERLLRYFQSVTPYIDSSLIPFLTSDYPHY